MDHHDHWMSSDHSLLLQVRGRLFCKQIISRQVLLNIARDYTWAWWSLSNLGYRVRKDGDVRHSNTYDRELIGKLPHIVFSRNQTCTRPHNFHDTLCTH